MLFGNGVSVLAQDTAPKINKNTYGLVLKSIDWHIGNMVTAGVGYKRSF